MGVVNIDIVARDRARAAASVRGVEAALARLTGTQVRAAAATREFARASADARAGLGGMGAAAAGLSKLARPIAGLFAVGKVASMAQDAAREFAALDDGLRRIGTLIPGQVAIQGELADKVTELSTAYGLVAADAASATFQAISAGVAARDAGAFMEVAARAAVAGFSTMEESVAGITTVINAWGLQAKEATRISDAMFTANKLGVTTSREIGAAIGQVAGMAAGLGVSYQDLFAATVALTKGGVSTAESMTGLRAILASLVAPSEDAAATAERLGIQWDAGLLRAKGLTGVVDALALAMREGGVEAVNTLVPRIEGAAKAFTLAGEAGSRDFAGALKEMTTTSGQTAEALGEVEGAALDGRRATAEMSAAWAEFGRSTLPIVTAATRALTSLLNAVQGTTEVQRALKGETQDQNEQLETFARRLIAGEVSVASYTQKLRVFAAMGVDVEKALGERGMTGAVDALRVMQGRAKLAGDAWADSLAADAKAARAADGAVADLTFTEGEAVKVTGRSATALKAEAEARKQAADAIRDHNAATLASLTGGERGPGSGELDLALRRNDARAANLRLMQDEADRARLLLAATDAQRIAIEGEIAVREIVLQQRRDAIAMADPEAAARLASFRMANLQISQEQKLAAASKAGAQSRAEDAQVLSGVAASVAQDFATLAGQAIAGQDELGEAILGIVGGNLQRLGGTMLSAGIAAAFAGAGAALFGLNAPGLIAAGAAITALGAGLGAAAASSADRDGAAAAPSAPSATAVGTRSPSEPFGGGGGGERPTIIVNAHPGAFADLEGAGVVYERAVRDSRAVGRGPAAGSARRMA